MKVVDLFCGIGGLSYGLTLAGFEVICGIDVDENFSNTFKLVHPNAQVLTADITNLTDREILSAMGEGEVLVGGPPCQAFSTAGKRALDDPRAYLVREFLRIVRLVKPEVVVFENVKGFTSFAKGSLVSEFLTSLYDMNYSCAWATLNAVNFGVPQRRERFVVLAVKSKYLKPNLLTVLTKKVWTFEEATSDLPPVESGQELDYYSSPPQNEYQEFCRRGSDKLTMHFTRRHGKRLIELIKRIPEGKSAHDIYKLLPEELRPSSGYRNTYKRITRSQPAPTITRNFCVPSSQNCIHPWQNRALTFREAMRLQSLPDTYPLGKLSQKLGKCAEAIGNAVPPLMAYAIGLSIKKTLNLKLHDDELVVKLLMINSNNICR